MAFNKLKEMLGDTEEIEEVEDSYSIDRGKKEKSKDIMSGNQVVLVEPRAYSESQTIADNLKSKVTVVVNLKRVTANQAKRIIDFFNNNAVLLNKYLYIINLLLQNFF